MISLALPAAPARAEVPSMWAEAGIGCGAVLANIIYSPAKVLYAAGGTIISGLAYVFSAGDTSVASPVLNASLRGDYVVTPEHLQGRSDLVFIGRTPRPSQASEQKPSSFEEEGF